MMVDMPVSPDGVIGWQQLYRLHVSIVASNVLFTRLLTVFGAGARLLSP